MNCLTGWIIVRSLLTILVAAFPPYVVYSDPPNSYDEKDWRAVGWSFFSKPETVIVGVAWVLLLLLTLSQIYIIWLYASHIMKKPEARENLWKAHLTYIVYLIFYTIVQIV